MDDDDDRKGNNRTYHRKMDARAAGELAMLGENILGDGVNDPIHQEISEDDKFGKRDSSRIVGPFYPEYSRFVGYE